MSPDRPLVLVTDRLHPQEHERLAAVCRVEVAPDAQPDTLRRLVADAELLIVRNKLPDDLFDHAPKLRAVVRHGVGLDMIPMAAANARRLPVANLPGSNTQAVVEYVLAALLQLRRGLATMDRRLREQGWGTARAPAEQGVELAGSTLGIVGVGTIGGRLATVAQALGMTVLGLTRTPSRLPAGVQAASHDGLFSRSDAVVLSCPLDERTRGLVDARTLALMKPDALLVNVSRGPVVVTDALLAALRAGRLGGAALDVHDRQPLTGDEPVFDAPNLLLTPHVAGTTGTSLRAMSRGAVDTALALLRGERPSNIVNPEVLP